MEYNLRTVTKASEKYKYLRFPLKIWILVNASGNRFIYWNSSETILVVDRDGIEKYLKSAGSIFCCQTLANFFWLMDFYGFELVSEYGEYASEDKQILLYKHSSFSRENRAYFEQLLRSQRTREVIDQRHENCSVNRAKIPRSVRHCQMEGPAVGSQSHLSSSSFAQEKLSILMEMKTLDASIRDVYTSLTNGKVDDEVIPVIEVPDTYSDKPAVSVPEYSEKRAIAGNYGLSSASDLKRFFGNYLPVYEDSIDMIEDVASEEENETMLQASEPVKKTAEKSLSLSPQALDMVPISTLATFDYTDVDDDGRIDFDSFKPAIDGADMVFLNAGPADVESLSDIKLDSECSAEKPEDVQFQLYSDIRETLDLLNDY